MRGLLILCSIVILWDFGIAFTRGIAPPHIITYDTNQFNTSEMKTIEKVLEEVTGNVDSSKMYIRIGKGAHTRVMPGSYQSYLKRKAGKLIEVNQENLDFTDYIAVDGTIINDNFITQVVNEKREDKGRCLFCGTILDRKLFETKCMYYQSMIAQGTPHMQALRVKDQCDVEGIEWFTKDNTPYLNK